MNTISGFEPSFMLYFMRLFLVTIILYPDYNLAICYCMRLSLDTAFIPIFLIVERYIDRYKCDPYLIMVVY